MLPFLGDQSFRVRVSTFVYSFSLEHFLAILGPIQGWRQEIDNFCRRPTFYKCPIVLASIVELANPHVKKLLKLL